MANSQRYVLQQKLPGRPKAGALDTHLRYKAPAKPNPVSATNYSVTTGLLSNNQLQGSFKSYNQRFPEGSAKKGESPREMNRITRRRAPGKPGVGGRSYGLGDTLRKPGRAASVVDS